MAYEFVLSLLILQRLLLFLERIIDHSVNNKMDMLNVSMVIAPNLFMSLPTRQNLDDVAMASKTSQVVRLLIKYHRLLWTVSYRVVGVDCTTL